MGDRAWGMGRPGFVTSLPNAFCLPISHFSLLYPLPRFSKAMYFWRIANSSILLGETKNFVKRERISFHLVFYLKK